MAKRHGIPAGVKRLFRVLHGRDARDDEERDAVCMALARDFGEQGIDERAADDRDVSDLDGFE
jgi:hypothetical protein